MTANGASESEFWERLDAALTDGSCLGTTLSQRRAGDGPERFTVRPTTAQILAAIDAAQPGSAP